MLHVWEAGRTEQELLTQTLTPITADAERKRGGQTEQVSLTQMLT